MMSSREIQVTVYDLWQCQGPYAGFMERHFKVACVINGKREIKHLSLCFNSPCGPSPEQDMDRAMSLCRSIPDEAKTEPAFDVAVNSRAIKCVVPWRNTEGEI